jgi:hypothetical protein
MTNAKTDKPLDQAHERAGYFLILVGGLIALLAAGAVLSAALGAQLDSDVKPLVYVAAIGAALAGFGTVTLLGVKHYAGLSIKAGQAEARIEGRADD